MDEQAQEHAPRGLAVSAVVCLVLAQVITHSFPLTEDARLAGNVLGELVLVLFLLSLCPVLTRNWVRSRDDRPLWVVGFAALPAILGFAILAVRDQEPSALRGELIDTPLFFAFVVMRVLVEEVLYRGVLLGWLLIRMSRWLRVPIAALLFALAHGNLSAEALLYYGSLGIAFGAAWELGAGLAPLTFAHLFFNWSVMSGKVG